MRLYCYYMDQQNDGERGGVDDEGSKNGCRLCVTLCVPADAGAAGSPLVQVYPTFYEQVYADDQHAIVTDDAVIAGAHWWFGVYALDGSAIIPREYTSISWRDGYYIASNASGSGVYASDGALLLLVEYDKIELDAEEDVAFACKD